MAAEVLSRRALNRATLARQLLLRRAGMGPLEAVEHLVGLQAQEPRDPYVALWSRLARFRPERLSRLLEERAVVRTVVMRGTIHLVTADDCLTLRPLTQPVVDAEIRRHPEYSPVLEGVDLGPVLAHARQVLAERPLGTGELRAALAERFPDLHAAALAYACRCKLALVQVPPRGLWGRSSRVVVTTAEAWLGRPLAPGPSLEAVALRYLAAFGPASVSDFAAWSRLTGLRGVIDRLRPRLRAFRDERGRELLDLPDAPRPEPGTPAPVRFLPEFDNALLSHADRSRFHTDEERRLLSAAEPPIRGAVLHDGFVVAVWRVERDAEAGRATLVVSHLPRLRARAANAVEGEGRRLMRLIAVDAQECEVRLVPLDAGGLSRGNRLSR